MSKLVICRLCFSYNIRMYEISNTRYQEMYEKHTGAKLITGDGRPNTVCYICNSQMQRFFKFLQMSQKAEKFYETWHNGHELTQEKVYGIATLHSLAVSTAHCMSLTGIPDSSLCDVEVTEVTEVAKVTPNTKYLEINLDKTEDVAVKIESVDYEEVGPDITLGVLSDDENEMVVPIPVGEINIPECFESVDVLKSDEVLESIENFSFDSSYTDGELLIERVNRASLDNETNSKEPSKLLKVKLERMPITRSQDQSPEAKCSTPFYSCKQCARRFRTMENLITHRKSIHKPRRSECEKCGKSYSRSTDLRRHILHVHTSLKPNTCPLCDRKFKHRSMFLVHVRTHTGEKPFGCRWCEKTFNDKSNCRKHMKIHTNNPARYACCMCVSTFCSRSRLRQHAVEHIL